MKTYQEIFEKDEEWPQARAVLHRIVSFLYHQSLVAYWIPDSGSKIIITLPLPTVNDRTIVSIATVIPEHLKSIFALCCEEILEFRKDIIKEAYDIFSNKPVVTQTLKDLDNFLAIREQEGLSRGEKDLSQLAAEAFGFPLVTNIFSGFYHPKFKED